LGRGYGYEELEKFTEAKEDMRRVRELQPANQEATKALARINKAIKEADKVDLSEVDAKMGRIKDAGNAKYTQKQYSEAIEKFTEGISLYLGNAALYLGDKDVRLKVTHLYTNRSLSYHQLGEQQHALEDADHVLKHLDTQNVKALNRRAVAYKTLGKVEESIRDYQTLLKLNPAGEKEIIKEIGDLMKKLVEIQKAKKKAAAPSQPKIQEIPTAATAKDEPEAA
jgi:tetratricopeptide (TPR) repeat protein